jgi:O-antigen chain-terminating methyltransferase
MTNRPVTSDDLQRLETERHEADRRYNEALTALDHAVPRSLVLPGAPASPDDHQVTRLNELWRVLPDAPTHRGRGFRTWLARFVSRLIQPYFERQQAFNSVLVDHINRNLLRSNEQTATLAKTMDALRDYAGALATFHSHLLVYSQQVTPFVDTKDRQLAAGLMATYDPALNAVTDEMLKRWESMVAREQRFVSRVEAVANAFDNDHGEIDQIRGTLATFQQATMTLKRELERLIETRASAAVADSGSAPVSTETSSRAGATAVDSYKYVGFENLFRGPEDEIRRRIADYVAEFAGAQEVLDVGCGRGEFLDLLRGAGVTARGIDLNHEMVEICRQRGLSAEEGDAVGYLESIPDQSIGGLFAAQVVEHLEPSYLLRLLELAYHRLRPGARIVLETINPACWYAFFQSYIRDLTHVRPIHPDTLKYLLTASGFQHVEIRYRVPYPEADKLQHLRVPEDAPVALRDAADTVNANMERLNVLLFTYLDYAAVATRL